MRAYDKNASLVSTATAFFLHLKFSRFEKMVHKHRKLLSQGVEVWFLVVPRPGGGIQPVISPLPVKTSPFFLVNFFGVFGFKGVYYTPYGLLGHF